MPNLNAAKKWREQKLPSVLKLLTHSIDKKRRVNTTQGGVIRVGSNMVMVDLAVSRSAGGALHAGGVLHEVEVPNAAGGVPHAGEGRFQAMTSSTALASERNILRGWNGKRTGILIRFTLTPKSRSVNPINISARTAKRESDRLKRTPQKALTRCTRKEQEYSKATLPL